MGAFYGMFEGKKSVSIHGHLSSFLGRRWSSLCVQLPSPTQSPVLVLQSCLPGYYRVDGILFGGICQPCECHGHAAECDIHGVCFVSPVKASPSPTLKPLLCRDDLKKKNASSPGNLPALVDPLRKSADAISSYKIFPAFFFSFFFEEKCLWSESKREVEFQCWLFIRT